MARAPSTQWREQVAADEDERFARYAQGMVAAQKRRTEKFGNGRALHRRQLGALAATLDVLDDLPEHARQGLFALPGPHEVLVRLSNGSMDFKVFGVDGPNALGTGTTKTQDFSLINHASFSAPKSAAFMDLVLALERGPFALIGYLVRTYGVFGALGQVKKLQAVLGKPFSGFATETFFSAVPISCGQWAARARLLPPAGRAAVGAKLDWIADLAKHLEDGPLVYRMQLQFFVDEATTPIEDASVDWPEAESPYLDVARLSIAPQAFDDEAAKRRGTQADGTVFDPWNALAAHRPLGDVMRARKVVYFASQQARGAKP
jgi:hypothetical protein